MKSTNPDYLSFKKALIDGGLYYKEVETERLSISFCPSNGKWVYVYNGHCKAVFKLNEVEKRPRQVLEALVDLLKHCPINGDAQRKVVTEIMDGIAVYLKICGMKFADALKYVNSDKYLKSVIEDYWLMYTTDWNQTTILPLALREYVKVLSGKVEWIDAPAIYCHVTTNTKVSLKEKVDVRNTFHSTMTIGKACELYGILIPVEGTSLFLYPKRDSNSRFTQYDVWGVSNLAKNEVEFAKFYGATPKVIDALINLEDDDPRLLEISLTSLKDIVSKWSYSISHHLLNIFGVTEQKLQVIYGRVQKLRSIQYKEVLMSRGICNWTPADLRGYYYDCDGELTPEQWKEFEKSEHFAKTGTDELIEYGYKICPSLPDSTKEYTFNIKAMRLLAFLVLPENIETLIVKPTADSKEDIEDDSCSFDTYYISRNREVFEHNPKLKRIIYERPSTI